ncbi:MAG: hypothetical protein V3T72_11810 [Thermoanaerobaculia bacterium]
MKPLLAAAGVRVVEERIGRPERFFQKTRQRDALRLSDYLATCAVLERDPSELLGKALNHELEPEIRPPRVVAAARRAAAGGGPGLGAERLVELEATVQTEPRQTRAAIRREIGAASRDEAPRLLGYYGSCLRVEADLARAELVLRQALEIALEYDLPQVEADLLIRLAFVMLEQQRVPRAIEYAKDATLGYARLGDREGEGRGFLASGMFRYYSEQYHESLGDLRASLMRPAEPLDRFSAHQGRALCWLALDDQGKAGGEVFMARQLAEKVPRWLIAKLDWIESRLARGTIRIDFLKASASGLCPDRPADCALISIELITEALAQNRPDLARETTMKLCALLERNPGPRIENAVLQLFRNNTQLTADLVAEVREALSRTLGNALARLASS